MKIDLRLEEPKDFRIVEELTREAFWGKFMPDCNEHLLVHKLRKVSSFVPELDFVAEINGKIVGNIMFSKSKVITNDGKEIPTLTFGPLSVLPEYQNCGIGKTLVNHTIFEAKKLGYTSIIIFGHPDYYPRFGFQRAKEFNITTPNGKNFDAFMAMPLYAGALDGISGKFYEDPIFNLNDEEKDEFEKSFPSKEKCKLSTIDELLKLLPSSACKAIGEHNISLLHELRHFYSEKEVGEWNGMDKNSLKIIRDTLNSDGHWGECSK